MTKKGVEYAWWQIAMLILVLLLILWYMLFASGLRGTMIDLLRKMFGFAP